MIKSAILKYWDNVRRLTLRILDLFPEHRFDYRPVETVRTVGEIFDHILAVELLVRKGLISGEWPRGSGPPIGPTDKISLRDRLFREHVNTLSMLRMLPEGRFMRIYQTPFGEISGEALVYLAIDEEIHHRGNLYTYLRILGIEPPPMVQNYGELFKEDKYG